MNKNSQGTTFQTSLAVGCTSLLSFVVVLYLYSRVPGKNLTLENTWLPIVLGLLGSSIFLSYNFMPRKNSTSQSEKSRRLWATFETALLRLSLGPIAGWLSFTMLPSSSATGQIFWLPFLAGFSSDLLVGIINKTEHTIKMALNIGDPDEKEPFFPAQDPSALQPLDGEPGGEAIPTNGRIRAGRTVGKHNPAYRAEGGAAAHRQ
jgi:hypothetical protein